MQPAVPHPKMTSAIAAKDKSAIHRARLASKKVSLDPSAAWQMGPDDDPDSYFRAQKGHKSPLEAWIHAGKPHNMAPLIHYSQDLILIVDAFNTECVDAGFTTPYPLDTFMVSANEEGGGTLSKGPLNCGS